MKNKQLCSAVLAMIALSVFCLLSVQCSSKKKLTSRYDISEESKIEQSVKNIESKVEQSDSTAVRKNTIDWSAINESLKITPIDPNKPSKTKFTPEANGGWSYETENSEVSTSKNQEQKLERYYDSIHKIQLLKLERKQEAELKAAAAARKKAREAEVETKGLSGWISIGIGLAIFVLLIIAGFTIYMKRSVIAGKVFSVLKKE